MVLDLHFKPRGMRWWVLYYEVLDHKVLKPCGPALKPRGMILGPVLDWFDEC